MAPPNSNHWTTDPEYISLMNFLIEKTRESVSVLNATQIAGEFKENSQSLLTTRKIRDRIRTLRIRIHAMKHIDMDTKVRLLFGLRAPVKNDFLEKLKTQAEVIVDDHQRIIKFKKKGGGLELSGNHITNAVCDRVFKRDERMMEFFAQKAMEADSPITVKTFVREFKKATGATELSDYLRKRYNALREKIHKSTDFDEKTKLRMMFVSSASVPNYFLKLLQKDALVEVDEKNRITKYEANDGSLSLVGDHSHSAKTRTGIAAKEKKKKKNKAENKKKVKKAPSDIEMIENRITKFVANDGSLKLEGSHRGLDGNSEIVTARRDIISEKKNLDTINSETDQLGNYCPSFNNFQLPEVKLEPFRGSFIDSFASMNLDEDVKAMPALELREAEKEVDKKQIDADMIEFPIKTEEDDFIIPKQEELEEDDDVKQKLFY